MEIAGDVLKNTCSCSRRTAHIAARSAPVHIETRFATPFHDNCLSQKHPRGRPEAFEEAGRPLRPVLTMRQRLSKGCLSALAAGPSPKLSRWPQDSSSRTTDYSLKEYEAKRDYLNNQTLLSTDCRFPLQPGSLHSPGGGERASCRICRKTFSHLRMSGSTIVSPATPI